jgi:hypothetical protein
MLALQINHDEAALLTRILDLYATELKRAAADSSRRDLITRLQQEQPLLRDVLAQLVSQQRAA